jgi:hypothetical protein
MSSPQQRIALKNEPLAYPKPVDAKDPLVAATVISLRPLRHVAKVRCHAQCRRGRNLRSLSYVRQTQGLKPQAAAFLKNRPVAVFPRAAMPALQIERRRRP